MSAVFENRRDPAGASSKDFPETRLLPEEPAPPPRLREVLTKVMVIPAWLEPRLKLLGEAWWRRVQSLDARASFRWLISNWQKIAAWWITAGLGLTAIFLLLALVTWQNPEVMAMRLIGWVTGAATTGGKVAALGSVVVLVLTLPLTLPGLALTGGLLLAGGLTIILFGPLLLLGFVAFGMVFSLALMKRGGSFVFHYIAESLALHDQGVTVMQRVRQALGYGSTIRDLEGKPKLLEADELKRVKAENIASDLGARIFLGYANGKAFFYSTEKNLIMFASTRSGKGRDLIKPNLKKYPHSVFVNDPKGENCKETAAERRAMGHTIAAFDPDGLSGEPCACFNPIAALLQTDDMGELIMGADYLAEALVIGKSDHWTESARGLIRALVLFIAKASAEDLSGRSRDLGTLRELLTGALDVTLERMQASDMLEGLVARLATSFKGVPDDERGSIVSTATKSTIWLDNPRLAALFRSGENEVTFEALRDERQKLSVFVCLSLRVFTTYPQIARLLVTFALDTMMRSLTGRRRPVMFILDELAQLEYLPIVSRAFTLGAGYGAQIWAIFQSVEQAAKMYPLDSLYGSSGIRCFFKLDDPESAEFGSKCASGVLTPAAVRLLGKFEMLTLLDGTNPLVLTRLGAYLPPLPQQDGEDDEIEDDHVAG